MRRRLEERVASLGKPSKDEVKHQLVFERIVMLHINIDTTRDGSLSPSSDANLSLAFLSCKGESIVGCTQRTLPDKIEENFVDLLHMARALTMI